MNAFEQAADDFLKYLEGRNAPPMTVKSYKVDLRKAGEFFATITTNPAELSQRHLRSYLASLSERGLAKSTVR